MKSRVCYKPWIFQKHWWNFEITNERKFTSITKCTPKFPPFFYIYQRCVKDNEEYCKKRKPSVYLHLDVFLLHGSTYWTCNSNKTLNFQMFPKIQSGVESRLDKLQYFFFVKLKCNRTRFLWPRISVSRECRDIEGTLRGESYFTRWTLFASLGTPRKTQVVWI